jgi:hypothetical protein
VFIWKVRFRSVGFVERIVFPRAKPAFETTIEGGPTSFAIIAAASWMADGLAKSQ